MLDTQALEKIKSEVGNGVVIVAATKNVSSETINSLKNHGITIAGENRVQELLTKFDLVTAIDWHFIGQLQTNKVKYIVDKVKMIQSVDRQSLVDEIQRQCLRSGKTMDVLIELNAGEQSKGGIDKDQLYRLSEYICGQKNLRLRGMMCLPPVGSGRKTYEKIKEQFDGLKARFDTVTFLSVGMSADYKIAVECGANMIRPGSILFGARN